MCKGLEEFWEIVEAKGAAKGEAIGEARLNKLMHILAGKGYQIAEILSMTSDAETRAKLYKEFDIA